MSKPVRLDRDGVPLPHGALARIGSRRFREPGQIRWARFCDGPDGATIAVGANRLALYRADGVCTRELKVETYISGEYALSPDGRTLCVADAQAIRLFDVASGKQRASKKLTTTPNQCVYVDDGSAIALVFDRNDELSLSLYTPDLASEQRESLGKKIHRVVVSPDGKRIAIAPSLGSDEQGAIVVRAPGAKTPQVTIPVGEWSRSELAFSPTGDRLAYTERGLRIRDLATGAEVVIESLQRNTMRVVFSPDGRRVATVGSSHVEVWDAATGARLFVRKESTYAISEIGFSADASQVVYGVEGTIQLLDVATGEAPGGREPALSNLRAAAISPDGNRVVTSSADALMVWDAGTGECIRRFPIEGTAEHLTFFPDGRRVVFYHDRRVQILALDGKGKPSWKSRYIGQCDSLAVSPDGAWFAAGVEHNGKKTVVIWDTKKRQRRHEIGGHKAPIEALRFSPDSATLGAGAADSFKHGDMYGDRSIVQYVSPSTGALQATHKVNLKVERLVFRDDINHALVSSSWNSQQRLGKKFFPGPGAIAAVSPDSRTAVFTISGGYSVDTPWRKSLATSDRLMSASNGGLRLVTRDQVGSCLVWLVAEAPQVANH